jgi:2,3-bisphosphoglycerate-dependent phosphoglycerate mutase
MPESTSIIQHFIFLRHGESVGNQEDRFQGHADFPLTDTGRLQAQFLADRWKSSGQSFDRAISSPLLRARETAEILCNTLAVPLQFDPDWKEIDSGLLTGLQQEEVVRHPAYVTNLTPYTHFGQTGESRWQLYLRAGSAVQRLLDQPAESTLIVAHGGILNMTLYAILGILPQTDHSGPRFQFHNTAHAEFTYDPALHTWRMLAFQGHPNGKEAWA